MVLVFVKMPRPGDNEKICLARPIKCLAQGRDEVTELRSTYRLQSGRSNL